MTKDLIFIKIILISAEEHKKNYNLFLNKNIKQGTEAKYPKAACGLCEWLTPHPDGYIL